MGARDCTRASSHISATRHARQPASMGARDCTRASPPARRTWVIAVHSLQWGRAIVRAQARFPARPPRLSPGRFNGGARLYARKLGEPRSARPHCAALQWGRAIVRAQALPAACYGQERRTRFNGGARLYARKPRAAPARGWGSCGFNGGARLYARKRCRESNTENGGTPLQWGRAIVRAQALKSPSSGIRTPSFNGGARLYARKRRARARAHRGPLVRFNGGARLYARKRHAACLGVPDESRLQWGRAIVRAQARRAAATAVVGVHASMGARDCTRASPAR